jgi:hypothetical protein
VCLFPVDDVDCVSSEAAAPLPLWPLHFAS